MSFCPICNFVKGACGATRAGATSIVIEARQTLSNEGKFPARIALHIRIGFNTTDRPPVEIQLSCGMDRIMKHLIALPVLTALASPAAQADILDFGSGPNVPLFCSSAPDGSGTPVACSNGAVISQAYGDTGAVDITYIDLSPQRLNRPLQWWSDSYNNLYGVVYAGTNADIRGSKARIEIKPKVSGMAISLSSFDFGSWPNSSLSTNINIYAIGGTTPLFTRSPITVGNRTPSAATSFTPNISPAFGVWIEWQNNAYNVAIDNIRFSVVALVDEPASATFVGAGLVVLVLAIRRARPRTPEGRPAVPGAAGFKRWNPPTLTAPSATRH